MYSIDNNNSSFFVLGRKCIAQTQFLKKKKKKKIINTLHIEITTIIDLLCFCTCKHEGLGANDIRIDKFEILNPHLQIEITININPTLL